jgi:nucleoside-diphosphate-sugar epimerase
MPLSSMTCRTSSAALRCSTPTAWLIGTRTRLLSIAELAALVAAVVGEIVYDRGKPDGAPRKLLDVGVIAAAGWRGRTALADGLRTGYAELTRTVG